ncbi:MAG: stage III sporulation protein AA [Ruminococcaceae bacterium]|nr:stage III sporulation protein AA [Oscillospiraceae bacterium]
MDHEYADRRFRDAASGLCESVRERLYRLPGEIRQTAQEIRLRSGAPLSVVCGKRIWFLGRDGYPQAVPGKGLYLCSGKEIEESVRILCEYSVHSHTEEIRKGYLTLRGGHRAGICGTAVIAENKILSLRQISSINLRVAREVKGAADEIFLRAFEKEPSSALIFGPPGSGKTTLLRDLVRQLSSGTFFAPLKVALIDERGEIGASCNGLPQNDIGPATDLLNGYPKGDGISIALRTLSPDFIVCDEIGSLEESERLIEGLFGGASFICTAHAYGKEALFARPQLRRLIECGVFQWGIELADAGSPGKIRHLHRFREGLG